MASPLVTDEIWERVRTLLPEPPAHPTGGRPPIGDREALTGILFVLKTGILWEDLPKEMGCGCGMTCVRRLRQWQQNGTWARMEPILKAHLRHAARYDWLRIGDSEQALDGGGDGQTSIVAETVPGETWATAEG